MHTVTGKDFFIHTVTAKSFLVIAGVLAHSREPAFQISKES